MTGITLESPIATVLGGGKKDATKAKALQENLGMRTVGDLLWHFPRTYLRTGEASEVGNLVEGQPLTVVADVLSSRQASYRDRRTGRTAFRVEAVIKTDGPALKLTLFARSKGIADWHERRLRPGAKGVFTGKVSQFNSQWQLAHPQMVMLTDDPDDAQAESALAMAEGLKALFPIYRTTGSVETWDIQRVVSFALTVVDDLPEVLPESVRHDHGLVDVHTALRWMHSPDDHGQLGAARKRFRFEEALVTQIVLARRRAAVRALGAEPREGGGGLLAEFDARLPFTLTEGQQQIGAQVEADLAQSHPMNRLLQGEVGSGKTLVALRAMLRVVDSGGQAALLAPTEVLAQQHHRSITAMLGDLAAGGMLGGAADATTVALLTGSMNKAARQEAMLRMASGEAGLVIGTHALLEDNVQFADLGLVVVDEQHRFGVEQRAALTDKAGAPPHLLVMTATPIPRTVAMTVFGDLEVSTLRELPAGRAPIQSNVVPLKDQPTWIERVWARVREEVEKGHQVYVVCPRIGGDEAEEGQVDQRDTDEEGALIPSIREGNLAAVEELAPELAEGALSGLRVEKLHGKMPPDDKDRVMRAFAGGEIDVLVSTTVIEVGVDVANATTMVLLDADRFGVSQLHQLRGRVGRGGLPGLCLLVTHSEAESPARERLDAVAASTDGFELSRIDLEQRHEGDVLGAGQSGFKSSLTHLKVVRDEKTIVTARAAAEALLVADPDLRAAPLLAERVDELEHSSQSAFMERS
ncbi:ATP-dependent DNA helicase RecG [Nocardioides sp. JQ2195]|uniref:ATP-dependent DNA helicase RecG n=1 Tax=Nocardioides sp. JQ2195 TaxID=2592334 RepID=UPI00143EAD62|nr:ATP-dependent DNA helicase RecG [Nocardioides sp. JQ2195]QIX26188.1 ATP-dependent DNA helicase RecG [Nocardioides sp. JQ2195]